ncbi:MAG: hypothetical protein KC680_01755 [Candidatus Peregrinibacteria bacterium]|nr:hypothetical protein [Candidatus Peregrinibacteria bacterium]MCB9807907.1 hypothetical protein [Candidatus Peribacteria bacterium]
MEITVQCGHTSPKRGTTLVSERFTSGRGEDVVMLLQIDGSPSEAKALEKECTTVIKHALLETDGEASSRLDGTLKELNGLLKGLTFSQSIQEIHALIGIVDTAGVLHVSHAGRSEAYVVRSGGASQITEYTRGKPTPAFVHIASGGLEPRDVIVFSSQRLLRTVTPAQLAQLVQRGDHVLDELVVELESEKEQAAICILHVSGRGEQQSAPARSSGRKRKQRSAIALSSVLASAAEVTSRVSDYMPSGIPGRLREVASGFLSDLKNPKRKRRAHFLLLAGTLAAFLVIWAVVNLGTSSQMRQSKAELEERLNEVDQLIRTAENRRLSGEMDSANAILEQAEQRAKQVMDNDNNLFRAEALDLLERVRVKREEINNIVRLSPRLVVNLEAKNDDIDAQGFIGLADGEFTVYDRQHLYRVLLNTVEDPQMLSDDELILDGDYFERYQTAIFQTTDNSIIEFINSQPTSMKTDDPAGWIKATDMETYLRFLYMLSPENNQIYKYERLSNRYSAPAEYNINGDLEGALDMAIDGNVYIVKKGGELMKLLRGEAQPFTIRHLPEGALSGVTKVYKVFDGNLYFLDPVHGKVIVATDGGGTAEGAYIKQYILEGDQVGELRDLYVDDEETKLYVIDEKRIHAVDLR